MDPFVGEILAVGFNYAPNNWALCAGQLMGISTNSALFSLLGTYYGGDGRSTFGLPNLVDRIALHQGPGPGLTPRFIGESGGSATITLLSQQTPPHSHYLVASTGPAGSNSPPGQSLANTGGSQIYSDATTSLTQINPASIGPLGNNNPHNNLMAFQAITWIISLQGIYPQRQ